MGRFYRKRPTEIDRGGCGITTDFKADLGKIVVSKFVLIEGYIMGLSLEFKHGGWHVIDTISMNMHKECEYKNPEDKNKAAGEVMQTIYDIIEDAGVDDIS